MSLRRFGVCLFLGAALTAYPAAAGADIIHVPGDEPTIQAGINAASDGDEVVLAQGEYFENIDLLGKAITVRSTDPIDPQVVAATIINGGEAGTVVTCDNGEDPLTVLEGLTITHSKGGMGIGIRISSSSPTVRRCVVSYNESNSSSPFGGGMSVVNGSPQVLACTFHGNIASRGAGIHHSGGNLAVTGCTFTNNLAWGMPAYGGALCVAGGTVIVMGSTFTDNQAYDACAAEGGAIYGCGGTVELYVCWFYSNRTSSGPCGGGDYNIGGAIRCVSLVSGCTFADNDSDDAGGAILTGGVVRDSTFTGNTSAYAGAIAVTGPVTNCTFTDNYSWEWGTEGVMSTNRAVVNCTFTGNSSHRGGAIGEATTVVNSLFVANEAEDGGGILQVGTVVNCTFVANNASDEGGGIHTADAVINCIFRGNSGRQIYDCPSVRYSNVEGGWPGVGNIDADPLFDADYRLLSGSPGIDAGHNWAIAGLADTDLDGNPRFAADESDFDPGCGIPVVVDMGAYEYQGDAFPVKLGDIDGDGAVGILDFLVMLAEWGPCDPGCCLADLDLDGAVGITDFLVLIGNWG
jgi:hypothetical protein